MLMMPSMMWGGRENDPNWSSCVLALRCDGANNSTTFTDLSPSPKTVTAFGDAKISTAQSLFYGSSLYMDGTGDYLTANIPVSAFGSNNWTLRGKFYQPSKVNSMMFGWTNASDGIDLQMNYATGSKAAINVSTDGSSFTSVIGTTDITYGVWHDLEACRSGNTLYLFLDGALEGTTSLTGSVFSTAQNLNIGRRADNTSLFNGYFQDIQIYIGVALHTASFTPPTSPFITG